MSRDIDVLVADLLAQKVLNAVDFPVSISVPASKARTGADELGEAELEISYDEPKVAGDNDVPEISTAFGDFILETARSVRDGSIDLSSEEPDQVKAMSVIASFISGGENDKKQLIEVGGDEVRQALEKIITKSAVSVDIEWIKVEA